MSKTKAKLTGNRCLCRGCGEYFSTVGNFDKHRRNGTENKRVCVDPAMVGLVIAQVGSNDDTLWRMPSRFAQ